MIIRDLTLSDFDAVNEIFKQLHELHVEHRPDIYIGMLKTPPRRMGISRRKF